MAQRFQTLFVSDLSGEDLGEDGETVTFNIKGVDYEIDLSSQEVAGFDEAVAMYIEHGRRVGGRRQSSPSNRTKNTGAKEDLNVIREWARTSGHQVSDRGRISKKVLDAYHAAH